ncbi:MAG: DNA-processing protein DprA [Anaerolineae bacterium]|nr:DNA-processing protein DprA [Anaerolineae bacterium]
MNVLHLAASDIPRLGAWHASLGAQAPGAISAAGNLDLLDGQLLAFFCSARAPGAIILQAHDLAQRWRHTGPVLVSGFHSPVESEVLAVLLRGPQPVVVCPARGLERMRLKAEYKVPLAEGRLLLLSPFVASVRRAMARTAQQRNRFVAALADAVLIAHAHRGSKTMAMAEEIVGWRKKVYTLDHPANEGLRELGVAGWDQVAYQKQTQTM